MTHERHLFYPTINDLSTSPSCWTRVKRRDKHTLKAIHVSCWNSQGSFSTYCNCGWRGAAENADRRCGVGLCQRDARQKVLIWLLSDRWLFAARPNPDRLRSRATDILQNRPLSFAKPRHRKGRDGRREKEKRTISDETNLSLSSLRERNDS